MRVGYFTKPSVEPDFDPGMAVNCPVCEKALEAPVKTISALWMVRNSSLFYRCHSACYEGIKGTPAETALDSRMIEEYERTQANEKQ